MAIIGRLLGDLTFSTSALNAVASFGGILAAATITSGEMWLIDLKTLKPSGVGRLTNGTTAATLAVMDGVTRVITPTAIYDFSGGGTVSTLTPPITPATNRYNGIALDPIADKAVYIGSSSASFVSINPTTPSSTQVTPSFMTGLKFTAVIQKPGTSNFIFGVSNGTIHEVSITGTDVSSFNLPAGVSDGSSARKMVPDSLALFGDNLFVGTAEGVLLHYTYSTGTLKNKILLARSMNNNSGANYPSIGLGTPVAGLMPVFFPQSEQSPQAFMIYDVNGSRIFEADSCYIEDNGKQLAVGIDTTTKRLWVSWRSGMVSVFDYPITAAGTEPTRIRVPSGTDVAGRVIRLALHDYHLQARIESDSSVISGGQDIAVSLQDIDYLEAAIYDDTTDKASARIFQG